jgi:hypothetical protein
MTSPVADSARGDFMRHTLKAVAAVAALACSSAAAAQVEFVPPSDPVGQVYTTNDNDLWAGGRGVVFSPTSDYLLNGVGLYQDLTKANLNFSLSLASAETGDVGGGTIITSGSQLVTTSGLEFVTFSFAPTLLTAGTYYHLNFSFTGNSNQNFFYDQWEAQPYSQPGFSGIDGTAGSHTSNTVLARIQLNPLQGGVPEPSTWAMMLLGFGAIGFSMRRQRKSVFAHAA